MPSPVTLLRQLGGGIPPSPVVSVAAESDTQIHISWTGFPNVDSYSIYRSVSAGPYSLLLPSIPPGTLSLIDSGLTAGTSYCYKVRALNARGSSPDSAAACASTNAPGVSPPDVPDAPASVTATALGSSEVRINWTAVDGADYYVGYRSTSGGAFVLDTYYGIPSSLLTYTKGGLSPSTNYCFKIHAANSIGESVDSPIACASTSVELLAPSPTYSHWSFLAGSYRSMMQRMVPNNDPEPRPGQAAQFGFFYACTFGFAGGNGGYMGMQTDTTGKRFIASIWGATGAWAVYPGGVASQFVEDGAGWKIVNPIDWQVSTDPQYVNETQFEIIESSTPHYWDIWFQHNITGALTASTRFQLGYFRVPASWGRLITNPDNFVEWYAPPPGCAAVPYSSVTFHAPIMNFDDPNFRPDRQYGHWHDLRTEVKSPCYADILLPSSPRVDQTATHLMGNQQ